MIRTWALLLLLGLLPYAPSGPARATPAELTAPGCADFLAQMHRKPPHVVFAGCRLLRDSQGKPLRATYRVDGRYAAVAEASLAKSTGLTRLRRSCCQWDAPPQRFVDTRGREFTLTMASGETTVTSRTQWKLIHDFEITVDTFTEDI